jgi:hypothetical protein
LNETRFTAQIIASKTKIVRLTLDVELGWVYFTNYTNDKQYVAASRYNYLLHTTQGLLSYAGQSDPWTRPSFVLDQPDNLIFWTQSSAIMRAISNGAQITTISDPKLTVTAVTYDKVRKNINFIVSSGSYNSGWAAVDLYTTNTDGSNPQHIGLIDRFSYSSYPQMSIISVYDGLVFVGYSAYETGDGSQTNSIGVFQAGMKELLRLWKSNEKESKIIVDLAYDATSQTLVWITDSAMIWKGQLNANNTKLLDVKSIYASTDLGEGIAITQSSCNFNCYLNGDCDTSTNQCACLPNYFPVSTCKTFCTRNATCSGHGSCFSEDGSCICDLNWEGLTCSDKKKDPPVFPTTFTAKNVTYSSPDMNTVTATINMYQPLQMERIDWSNGSVTIFRYDLGFRFDLYKGTCNTSIISGQLPVFRVPADSVLKGSTQCSAPTPCNEWWSAKANQMFYTAKDPALWASEDLPVMVKDYTTLLVISYDISVFVPSTPDKSLFDFPSTCLPKFT